MRSSRRGIGGGSTRSGSTRAGHAGRPLRCDPPNDAVRSVLCPQAEPHATQALVNPKVGGPASRKTRPVRCTGDGAPSGRPRQFRRSNCHRRHRAKTCREAVRPRPVQLANVPRQAFTAVKQAGLFWVTSVTPADLSLAEGRGAPRQVQRPGEVPAAMCAAWAGWPRSCCGRHRPRSWSDSRKPARCHRSYRHSHRCTHPPRVKVRVTLQSPGTGADAQRADPLLLDL